MTPTWRTTMLLAAGLLSGAGAVALLPDHSGDPADMIREASPTPLPVGPYLCCQAVGTCGFPHLDLWVMDPADCCPTNGVCRIAEGAEYIWGIREGPLMTDLVNCLTGPGVRSSWPCRPFDADCDLDVDLEDWATWEAAPCQEPE